MDTTADGPSVGGNTSEEGKGYRENSSKVWSLYKTTILAIFLLPSPSGESKEKRPLEGFGSSRGAAAEGAFADEGASFT